MNRAVFLDRDNTIIANDGDLGDPAQVKLLQGAATAIASIRGLGFKIVVVSNQGGVARGKYAEADVDAVNARIAELLKQQANGGLVDRFYYCPFHPEGAVPRYRKEHPWRKPQPGMLLAAAEDLKLDLPLCWMVGDQSRDIDAGKRAGTRTIRLYASGHDDDAEVKADFVARNLVEVARIIAQHLRPDLTLANLTDAESAIPASGGGTTFPGVQKTGAQHTSATPQRQTPPRPFKPWAIQPETPGSPGNPETPVTSTASAPVSTPIPTPEPIAPDESHEADTPPTHQVPHLLQQILRHMKHTQADKGDWTLFKTVGLGLAQPLAGVCALLAALNTASPTSLLAWLLGAIFLQLVVLTMLHLHDHQ
ncbi:MAG: D-glycero-alpha-D-manno-heptose-1,7-bisphosphate 7-phosphatase [Phycisphaerales bacterium]